MPALAFDKFIPLLGILLVLVGVCLTWPLETLVMLKVLFTYFMWPASRYAG